MEINNRFNKQDEKLGDINNEIVNIRNKIKPVSYTHLDVYKRQMLFNGG